MAGPYAPPLLFLRRDGGLPPTVRMLENEKPGANCAGRD